MSNPAYKILLRPVLTEKSTAETERSNTYRFEVASTSNRIEIGRAVEHVFSVEVEKVRTLIRGGKARRRGRHSYRTPSRKIAVVQLKEGQKIDLI